MRILTNLSKAELNQLTSQPTAKAMIEKVRSEGIYVPQGDAKAAAQFVAQRQNEKRADSFEISDKGLTALKNSVLNKQSVPAGNKETDMADLLEMLLDNKNAEN
ncbi:MAG: hypothetical protein J6A41_08630 [Ruminiclostridium sp.]|nr:hypothetical protein [Ruminiclostridium sp.]